MRDFLFRLISDNGFARFQQGLGSRFRANGIQYEITYAIGNRNPSLTIRLEKNERASEVVFWESGNYSKTRIDGESINDSASIVTGDNMFHEIIKDEFLFVINHTDI